MITTAQMKLHDLHVIKRPLQRISYSVCEAGGLLPLHKTTKLCVGKEASAALLWTKRAKLSQNCSVSCNNSSRQGLIY